MPRHVCTVCKAPTSTHLQVLEIQQLAPRGRDGSSVVGIAQYPAVKKKERRDTWAKKEGMTGRGGRRGRGRGGGE